MPNSPQPQRLNKYLALALGVSRREADDLIANGRVTLVSDGQSHVAALGERYFDTDEAQLDGERVVNRSYTYLAMNKPAGYVSSRRAQGAAPTLYELLPEQYRTLKTVGRLDKDSSGLILLTNDGDFAFQMTHPKFTKVKIYEAALDRGLEPLHQQMIADLGVDLPDGRSQLGLERGADRKHWTVTMHEGRNRQIRRTFGALGYTVVKLHRVQFGPYRLEDLAEGGVAEVAKFG
jgi:23S rRNA pseudouridine2605 synthase